MDQHRDPVCGNVIRGPTVARVVIDGRPYYVCSRACQAALVDTPHRYVGWPVDARSHRLHVRATATRLRASLHLARVHAA